MARNKPDEVVSLSETVASGDHRASLEAQRDCIAGLLEVCEPREAAALSRELRALIGQIVALAGAGGGSELDELRKRRAARRTGT